MRMMNVTCLALGLSSTAFAQTLTSSVFISAQCGGSNQTSPGLGLFQDSIHGLCPAPRDPGGIASINDATAQGSITPGDLLTTHSAHSDFRGTHDGAGAANSQSNFICTATDLVFTRISNPLLGGSFPNLSFDFDFAMQDATQGFSNCDGNQPLSTTFFMITCDGARAQGTISVVRGGFTASEYAASYPNDGSTMHATSTAAGSDYITPHQFMMWISARASVAYCDFPPADIGDAAAMVRLSLPCGVPVFNLPPDTTANSVQLGIVNNIRVGASFAANGQPTNATTCLSAPATFSVSASGASLTYQWQWRDQGATTWLNVVEGSNLDSAQAAFAATGAHSANLFLTAQNPGTLTHPRREVRVIVTSPCGNATSSAALWTVCLADFNCDTVVDFFDYLDFVDAFSSSAPASDFNGDGTIDFFDYLDFVDAFSTGC